MKCFLAIVAVAEVYKNVLWLTFGWENWKGSVFFFQGEYLVNLKKQKNKGNTTHENSVGFLVSFFLFCQRSDTDVIHVQLIAPLLSTVCLYTCVFLCACVHDLVFVRVCEPLEEGEGGTGKFVFSKLLCIPQIVWYTYLLHPLKCLFPRISKQRPHRCATLLLLVMNSCVCRNLPFLW